MSRRALLVSLMLLATSLGAYAVVTNAASARPPSSSRNWKLKPSYSNIEWTCNYLTNGVILCYDANDVEGMGMYGITWTWVGGEQVYKVWVYGGTESRAQYVENWLKTAPGKDSVPYAPAPINATNSARAGTATAPRIRNATKARASAYCTWTIEVETDRRSFPRVMRMQWGDGTYDDYTVPAGSGPYVVEAWHEFPGEAYSGDGDYRDDQFTPNAVMLDTQEWDFLPALHRVKVSTGGGDEFGS